MKALVTGITGQDGSHIADLLLEKGYEVHGLVRRSSTFNTGRIDHIREKVHLHYGDLGDQGSLEKVIQVSQPDEVYNFGGMSHVRVSFDMPEYTMDIVACGVVRLLDAIKSYAPKAKLYQASSSEMFGKVAETPQRETTHFYPRSPYGVAKAAGFHAIVNYREAYGLFACNGILFNHEGPRRGENFVTRKITKAVAEILTGKKKELFLGNLEARRDWGYAGDYVAGAWMMLQQGTPDDYVLASGETHSVREFLEEAFGYVGLKYEDYVKIDERLYRPAEVDLLLGDATKARTVLGWEPKVHFKELVRMMVDNDIKLLGRNNGN